MQNDPLWVTAGPRQRNAAGSNLVGDWRENVRWVSQSSRQSQLSAAFEDTTPSDFFFFFGLGKGLSTRHRIYFGVSHTNKVQKL